MFSRIPGSKRKGRPIIVGVLILASMLLVALLVVGVVGLVRKASRAPAATPTAMLGVFTPTPETTTAPSSGPTATTTRRPTNTPVLSAATETPAASSTSVATATSVPSSTGAGAATLPSATPVGGAAGETPNTGFSALPLLGALGVAVVLLAARRLRTVR